MRMGIKGVVGHVIQGSKVLLQCEVQAARPPANVTWYNGTEILEKNSSRLDMYETKLTDNVSSAMTVESFIRWERLHFSRGTGAGTAARGGREQKASQDYLHGNFIDELERSAARTGIDSLLIVGAENAPKTDE